MLPIASEDQRTIPGSPSATDPSQRIGIDTASWYSNVRAGAIVASVLQLPFLSLVSIGPDWLWYLIPTRAPLLLIQGAFEPLETGQWAYALGMSVVMLAGAAFYCRRRFDRHVRLADARRAR